MNLYNFVRGIYVLLLLCLPSMYYLYMPLWDIYVCINLDILYILLARIIDMKKNQFPKIPRDNVNSASNLVSCATIL